MCLVFLGKGIYTKETSNFFFEPRTDRDGGPGGGGTRYIIGEMYSISCMAEVVRPYIDPRLPTMSGRSKSGFHRPGRHCLHQGGGGGRVLDIMYPISCMAVVVWP